MGWASTAALIGGYALAPWTGGASIPIGTAIAQGINAKGAANKAATQQQAGTDAASADLDQSQQVNSDVYGRQTQAGNDVYNEQKQAGSTVYDQQQRTSGQVVNQQRSDYQALANQPYQTLGAALGINIPDVMPMDVTSNTLKKKGAPAEGDLKTKGAPEPWQKTPDNLPHVADVLRNGGGTLAEFAPVQKGDAPPVSAPGGGDAGASPLPVAQQQSQSSYATVRGPDGSTHQVPHALVQALLKEGATVVA